MFWFPFSFDVFSLLNAQQPIGITSCIYYHILLYYISLSLSIQFSQKQQLFPNFRRGDFGRRAAGAEGPLGAPADKKQNGGAGGRWILCRGARFCLGSRRERTAAFCGARGKCGGKPALRTVYHTILRETSGKGKLLSPQNANYLQNSYLQTRRNAL